MPGIVLNPIANFGFGQGVQPYIPTYDSVYVSSLNLYQVSGSVLGGTTGGIAKMDFSGSLDTTWNTAVNVANGANRTLKSVDLSGGARNNVLLYCQVTSASVDYREFRLVDKTSGAISSSTDIFRKQSVETVENMTTDPEEKHIYVFGQRLWGLRGSGSSQPSPTQDLISSDSGLERFPYGSLNEDTSFSTNLGTGPEDAINNYRRIYDVHINKNGKIGVVHSGRKWNSTTVSKYYNFVVLNNDGTVDTSFDFGSAQFLDQFGSEIPNGALRTCHWFEVGSTKVWVVGGIFRSFNSDTSYQKMMAFNEDGSINTAFTNNFKEGVSSNNLNADVLDITNDDTSPEYGLVMGNFTQRGSDTARKVLAIDGQGYPQIFGSGTKSNVKKGVVHNNQLYYLYDGTSTQDQSGTTVNVDGMYALNVYDFNHTSYFDIGAGLEQNGGASASPGSIFLG